MIAGSLLEATFLVLWSIGALYAALATIAGAVWVAAKVRDLLHSPSARVTAPGGGGAAGNGARPGRLPVDAAAPSAASGLSGRAQLAHKKDKA